MKQWNSKNLALGLSSLLGGIYCFLRGQSDAPFFDLSIAFKTLKFQKNVKALYHKHWSAADFWDETLKKNPEKLFFTYIPDEGDSVHFTYRDVDVISNQYANWFYGKGIEHNDVVALYMENKPEFIFIQIAAAKVGATLALINSTQKGAPLDHSLKISEAKLYISGPENAENINHLIDDPNKSENILDYFYIAGGDDCGYGQSIDDIIRLESEELNINLPPPNRNIGDTYCYIYTSGTTGYPKASIISHARFYIATLFGSVFGYKPSDKIYISLPLYHSAANLIGFSVAIQTNCSFVIRRKFSVSKFWQDCYMEKCTIIQYIGELLRYLVNSPPGEYDTKHSVRMAVGNGLRPDIWREFQQRFGIQNIGEFYASTEGNATLVNIRFKEGAVGYFPKLLDFVNTSVIVKYDVENDCVVRDSEGFCIPCGPGEVGEMLGRIKPDEEIATFSGYTNKEATEKKILRNVFENGDTFFRTGDLLMRDSSGFYYFIDRIGDTFRWKGENVSTSEVELVLNNFPGLLEINVYGAQIPHRDGRAGMAAIGTVP
eukprot:TRINITY_DN960_c1_g1_i2.p1 TRINITY_DN960_c1_g1~~TRINITY_DN960_c1_g1_i2.p1  ORF type:complete len:556 (+),score=124.32 TRINITY_DN960_c1_g1_i2:34-1668(+)